MEFSNGIIETAKKPRKKSDHESEEKKEGKEPLKVKKVTAEKSTVESQESGTALVDEGPVTEELKE